MATTATHVDADYKPMTLQFMSSAFGDDEPIPREDGYTERNVNPPLEIGGVPDDADSLALVVDNPRASEYL